MSYTLRSNPASTSNYTKGRLGHKVSKIVIHHAATTDFDGIGRTFRSSRGVSAHYGVGKNNNVDRYVGEGNIAWACGNWAANCTSISIENVNDTLASHWAIRDETFNTLVELVYDIAKRHGLLPLKVNKTLYVEGVAGHRDFSATACPMALYPRLQELADRVNKMSGGSNAKPPKIPNRATDQIIEIGSKISFPQVYRVDDMQKLYGIWQVRTNKLCPVDFTWHDNAVPVMPLVEVNSKGRRTADQILNIGSRYKIPGKYRVLNLAKYKSRWLAQISMSGYRVWIDVASVREVA